MDRIRSPQPTPLSWGHAPLFRGKAIHLLLLVLLFLANIASLSLPDDDTLIDHLDIVAFGNEYTKERFPRVRKWRTPIRMGIQGKSPTFLDANIRQHARELQRLTGHPMELIYSENMRNSGQLAPDFDRKQVNLILFFVPASQIHASVLKYFDNDKKIVDNMIQSSTCFAKFFKKKDEIRAAVVVMPSHLSREALRACVVEELTQIMGLPNDSDLLTDSIFNDKSRFNEWTDHDQMLLRMLYHPGITIGMERQQALDRVRKILPELRKTKPSH